MTYVLPVVAITLGFIFLGERLRPIELVGAALVIGGVVLVNGGLGRRPGARGRRAASHESAATATAAISADLDARPGS